MKDKVHDEIDQIIYKDSKVVSKTEVKEEKPPKEVKKESKPIDMDKLAIDEDIRKEVKAPSDLSKITELLLNEQFPRRKTILGRIKLTPITTLDTIAQLYDVSWLKLWIPAHCEYLTSEGGKGRQDIVDITKYSIERENEQRKNVMELLGNKR